MSNAEEIFVRVLDEPVPVWRPVQAVCVHGNAYEIVDQPYDREVETWQFVPGDTVIVENIDTDDGEIPAAIQRSE